MQVEFTEARETINYGRVNAGQVVEVSPEDGAAFIAGGVAKKPKKVKEQE